jgi:hypothetical protein
MSVLPARQPWLDVSRKRIELEIPLAGYLTSAILLAFVASNEYMWHWFVIPVFVCGLLIGPDTIRWLRGKYDLFDPKGVVGALGYHLFFLAPLLFIHWDVGMRYVVNPPDWRPWVGYLSVLNVVSLIIYQKSQNVGFHAPVSNEGTRWIIDPEHALPLFLVFGGVALTAQAYFLFRVGGIAGIIHHTIMRVGRPGGLGLFEIAGNSLPMIVFIYLTVLKMRSEEKRSSFFAVAILLFILIVAQFVLGGMRGSRSATVWSLFWIAGIVHCFWRPIGRLNIVVGLIILVVFMYIYGFYKTGGSDAIEMLVTGTSFSELEEDTGRTFSEMLIGDLSRVNVQSYQLYRLRSSAAYDLRWGKTYVVGLIRFIPSWVWPARPPDAEKVVAGTELLYGREYISGNPSWNASYVYGLVGEAMLNFGILSVPIPFAIWGFLMGRYRHAMLTWRRKDARRLLAPFATLLFMVALIGDLDNLLAALIGKGSFVTLLILLSSKRSAERVSS